MHRIIYLSWATAPLTEVQLQDLLHVARCDNNELGITGILLYGNNRFMQVLEGEAATVQKLYEHIKRDPRHRDVIAYADKPITQRAFGEWAMAFQATTPSQFEALVGYLVPTDFALDFARLQMADAHLIDLLRSFTLP